MPGPVAVIDIGSNSIKVLVADRGQDEPVKPLFTRTIDARISAGISNAEPQLAEEGMARGVDAIRALLQDVEPFAPTRTLLVATSAVRDARNGADFRGRVKEATGHEIRILTGQEEASLIGRGLTCDPALRSLRNFYVFDLGGGSLECLSFRDRQLEQAASLQLGCVRLTEMFVPDPAKTLGRTPRYRIMQHVHDELVHGEFKFDLPRDAIAVGTGGTITTVRAIMGAPEGKSFDQVEPFVAVGQFRLLLTRLARMNLDERRAVPGLPAQRADIFPAALATLIVLTDVARVPGYRHSLYNLRYGLAAQALDEAKVES